MLAKFEIGRVNDTEFPPYKPDSGFYKALCKRVGQYFKEKNLNPKVRRVMITLLMVTHFLSLL